MRAPSLAPALGPCGLARWAIFAAALAARLRTAEAFRRVRAYLRRQAELREAVAPTPSRTTPSHPD
eukprot:12625471-Heterocapsa_arctica.AAC.1